MIFRFSLDSSCAAVAAAVFMAAAPINANRFPLELRKGNVEEPLSTEKNPYIPRKLAESNGNDDLDVHKEGIKRSLSMENKIWPATRGYQPTIKNSFRAPQTDNNKATVWSRDAHLLNTPIFDLGILDKGFGRTDVDVPAITNADRERDEAEALAASSSSAFTGYYEESSSETSASYQNDDPLGNPTTSARSLSDSYCYEQCGVPSQRPIVTDSTIRNAIKKCKYDNTSSGCPYPNIEMQCWNTSAVTEMSLLFSGYTNFNEPLGCWDVSSVRYAWKLFGQAEKFNQNINRWDVSAIQYMGYMFYYAKAFNQPLNDWDTSLSTNMRRMFSYARSFSQPIGDWDVSSVKETYEMFRESTAFNQQLDEWDLSSVTRAQRMFSGASLNQCLSTWPEKFGKPRQGGVYVDEMFQYTFCPNYCSFCYDTGAGTPESSETWCQGPEQNCFPPTPIPSGSPTSSFSPSATFEPSASPSDSPSSSPTVEPTKNPTESPTDNPTESPTNNPTESPTNNPTENPTNNPTKSPTENPTENPTNNPTESPTENPTENPTNNPTESPTNNPTESPTENPTETPTESPTKNPTETPTENPTENPTNNPTEGPTENPTEIPTENPTESPTENPTRSPTPGPTSDPCKDKSEPFSAFLSCDKLASLSQDSLQILCNDLGNEIATNCPELCPEGSTCSPTPSPTIDCEDKSKNFKIKIDGTFKTKGCIWLAKKKKSKVRDYCKMKVKINGSMKKLSAICKETCGKFGKGECAFLKDL